MTKTRCFYTQTDIQTCTDQVIQNQWTHICTITGFLLKTYFTVLLFQYS